MTGKHTTKGGIDFEVTQYNFTGTKVEAKAVVNDKNVSWFSDVHKQMISIYHTPFNYLMKVIDNAKKYNEFPFEDGND